MADAEHCGNCSAYKERAPGIGQCHAQPPQVNWETRDAAWPQVTEADWCRQWARVRKAARRLRDPA